MSGFDPGWLFLREPADRLARSEDLAREAGSWLAAQGSALEVLDIGCGTGSTLRSLAPVFPQAARWILLDNDPALLEQARQLAGETVHVSFARHDLNDIAGLPLEGVSLLTASALFDLCSEGFCAQLVKRAASEGCAVYAALNYDGVMRWSVAHPLDQAVRAAFNRHQQTDKGFGTALGPDAASRLAVLLEAEGYRVRLAESPWVMGPGEADLQRSFLKGFRQPLMEIGELPETGIDDWLSFRLKAVHMPESRCEVGHLDLLALPA
ncbi:class I SAM-dependent methyltransferase [Roseibium suaedae]|uniref:Methyltransferase domain-containing protein n=1 Tax=Roseibium suaedae TaxID=735517 RepID=A0A1M7HZM3_9HYPH|nr:class I SAM-dependent methyltransferase [Roseibium suaedae]SHM33944.1 Methyltransferase domain-containing protein [Roseibium suaedae]